MSSGVMAADMLEGTKFALGATMAVRKEAFAAVGGFPELGQFYADDFVLGNRLADAGLRECGSRLCDPAAGGRHAVRAVVPQSAAMDAEHAKVKAVGTSGQRTDVCDAVRPAGPAVGIAERAPERWESCGWRRWW